MLSIVIPVHNEEPSLLPLYDRLTAVLESMQKQYERSIGLVESRLKHMHGKPVNVEHHAGADARR